MAIKKMIILILLIVLLSNLVIAISVKENKFKISSDSSWADCSYVGLGKSSCDYNFTIENINSHSPLPVNVGFFFYKNETTTRINGLNTPFHPTNLLEVNSPQAVCASRGRSCLNRSQKASGDFNISVGEVKSFTGSFITDFASSGKYDIVLYHPLLTILDPFYQSFEYGYNFTDESEINLTISTADKNNHFDVLDLMDEKLIDDFQDSSINASLIVENQSSQAACMVVSSTEAAAGYYEVSASASNCNAPGKESNSRTVFNQTITPLGWLTANITVSWDYSDTGQGERGCYRYGVVNSTNLTSAVMFTTSFFDTKCENTEGTNNLRINFTRGLDNNITFYTNNNFNSSTIFNHERVYFYIESYVTDSSSGADGNPRSSFIRAWDLNQSVMQDSGLSVSRAVSAGSIIDGGTFSYRHALPIQGGNISYNVSTDNVTWFDVTINNTRVNFNSSNNVLYWRIGLLSNTSIFSNLRNISPYVDEINFSIENVSPVLAFNETSWAGADADNFNKEFNISNEGIENATNCTIISSSLSFSFNETNISGNNWRVVLISVSGLFQPEAGTFNYECNGTNTRVNTSSAVSYAFTVPASTPPSTVSGGGGGTIIRNIFNETISITNTFGGDAYNILAGKGTTQKRDVFLFNKATIDAKIKLKCKSANKIVCTRVFFTREQEITLIPSNDPFITSFIYDSNGVKVGERENFIIQVFNAQDLLLDNLKVTVTIFPAFTEWMKRMVGINYRINFANMSNTGRSIPFPSIIIYLGIIIGLGFYVRSLKIQTKTKILINISSAILLFAAYTFVLVISCSWSVIQCGLR